MAIGQKHFSSVLDKLFGIKLSKKTDETIDIVKEMRQLCREYTAALSRYDSIDNDNELIESSIYEIESIMAKYAFLLKKARESNLKCSSITEYDFGGEGRKMG